MTGDFLHDVQYVIEQALSTGLIWTGAIVLVVILSVIGLAFSPTARPRIANANRENNRATNITPKAPRRRRPSQQTQTASRTDLWARMGSIRRSRTLGIEPLTP